MLDSNKWQSEGIKMKRVSIKRDQNVIDTFQSDTLHNGE